ncbi:MAG: hypothetical protein IH591_13815, partial [Bacteroidales bacterium]|nr:hypothetical protein [Bacteroidales bacterium]
FSLLVEKNTILITRSGTVGKSVLVGDYLRETVISEHAIKLIIDENKLSSKYVFGYLNTTQGLRHLEASAFGSVIITLNEDYVGNIEIPIIDDADVKKIIEEISIYQFKLDSATQLENNAIKLIEKEIESWQN